MSSDSDRGPLFSDDVASDFVHRWEIVQATFVDDPARAVRDADDLTGELLDRLRSDFDEHRVSDLDVDDDAHSEERTEKLRRAFQRYRSFFERLLQA